MSEALNLSTLGLSLIILGVFLIIIGMILVVALRGGEVEWGGGAIIFVGPIPIAIGGGRLGHVALLIAALLTLAMIVLMFTTAFYLGKQPTRGA